MVKLTYLTFGSKFKNFAIGNKDKDQASPSINATIAELAMVMYKMEICLSRNLITISYFQCPQLCIMKTMNMVRAGFNYFK
jgi:hypothetical protein